MGRRVCTKRSRERQGCPTGSRGTSGVSRGEIRGATRYSRGSRTALEGSLGDPKGLRGASRVYQGVKGDARGVQVGQQGRVRDVPGVKGSQGDPKELRGTSGEY